jgi:hypothetical protein
MLITTLIVALLAAADAHSFRVVLPPIETPLSQRLAATVAPLLRKSLSRAFYALLIFGAGILVAAGRIWMKDGGECLKRVGRGDDEAALLMTEGQRGQQAVIIIATLTVCDNPTRLSNPHNPWKTHTSRTVFFQVEDPGGQASRTQIGHKCKSRPKALDPRDKPQTLDPRSQASEPHERSRGLNPKPKPQNLTSAPRALSATLITVTFVVFAHLMAQVKPNPKP